MGRFRMLKIQLKALFALLAAASWVAGEGTQLHPVYVGARVCGKCHSGVHMGHQLSKWLNSKHADAYAALAKPSALEITRLSGITEPPQEAAVCLGCHATGAQAEDWEKDDTFNREDGVQCERCHGPGSEYMEESVMMDPARSSKAGLRFPTEDDCMNCHAEKGSHTAVLGKPDYDVKQAFKAIAHGMPKHWKYPRTPKPPAGKDGAKYVGSLQCAKCHKGAEKGHTFSHWRMSAHARAYSVLATDAAHDMAKKAGLTTPPQESPVCLGCHTTAFHDPGAGVTESYVLDEGVGCEACHGPGSRYAASDMMKKPGKPYHEGLHKVSKDTCRRCHDNPHGRPFDVNQAMARIAHPGKAMIQSEAPQYKTPLNMALHPSGKMLYVACEASHSVVIIDAQAMRLAGEIKTGGQPHDVTFSPDGKLAYVSNRLDDTISIIDTRRQQVIRTLPVGDEPHGLLMNRPGSRLYVINTGQGSVSVLDAKSLKEVKRITTSRAPWSLALSPDGKALMVTNNLPYFGEFRATPVSEITMVDTEDGLVSQRIQVADANLLQGVTWHPSGEYALFTLNRTKNLVPMTRLLQGWTITNGLGIAWRDGRVDQVLLDEPGRCFPDPTDVAVTPDGRYALVTSSGDDRVAVVDLARLMAMLDKATPYERTRILPNHLGKPTEFVVKHINVPTNPRGILVTPDGRFAYVANSLDDSVSVIDLAQWKAVKRIDLGGPKVITKARYGERIFHSASSAFNRQFSCHTCHPDGHVNGLTFDIEPDGIGLNPVDNRTLRGILDTAPFKWEGTNPSLSRQCGPRLAVFFTRIQPFTPEELSALDYFICTIPRPPNRHRPVGAELTEAQRRGKLMFQRTVDNSGQPIPMVKRCTNCHFPPLFTDRKRHRVGEKFWLDYEEHFDTPHLNNIYDSAPYLHNGKAQTLEEIWTRFNPYDDHGMTNDMTKDQLNDLIEYLKTL